MNLNEFMLFLSYVIFGFLATYINSKATDWLLKVISGFMVYAIIILGFIILIRSSGG